MSIDEFRSSMKELFQELQAMQRAIALNQKRLSIIEDKVDRILTQRDKRYIEVGYRG